MLEFGSPQSTTWSFEPSINIFGTPTKEKAQAETLKTINPISPQPLPQPTTNQLDGSLGDFTEIWKHLGIKTSGTVRARDNSNEDQIATTLSSDFTQLIKGVKWRDEYDGADLEDNVEAQQISASNLRTRKRAARRARARERLLQLGRDEVDKMPQESGSDAESAEELASWRRSPDRRALIASLVGRPRPQQISPPTSPSPPKDSGNFRTPTKKDWPVSNPFLWAAPVTPTSSSKTTIVAQDGFTARQRSAHLISKLALQFPEHRTFLSNSSLLEQAFLPLNVSPIGVHVFVDMSNIAIGFHDCLKMQRGIPITTRVRRVPLNFHNLALVLERGRPAAKRVVCGSDRTSTIDQAENSGYEVNILDRVHKAKTPTPKARKQHNSGHRGTAGGYNSASGMSYGETSGSETPGYSSMPTATYKWSEQAVDEILHLKIALSIVDSETPSTMVLATGDAAEAEYSDGFLRMVERALKAGWAVELVSFRLNTSNLYKRKEWRARYGSNFKWIQLDDFAESLIDEGA